MKLYVFILYTFAIFKSCELKELPDKIPQFIYGNDYRENHLLKQLIRKQFPVGMTNNSSTQCVKAVVELLGVDFDLATLKFLDAWGNIPSGILYGHLVDLGNFDECLSARKPILRKELRGKYFLIQAVLSVNSTLTPKSSRQPFSQSRMVNVIMESLAGRPSLTFGTCFPHVCSVEDVRKIFQTPVKTLGELSALLSGGKNVENSSNNMAPVYFYVRSSSTDKIGDESYDMPAILAISIFSAIGVLMLLSSFYEYFMALMDAVPNQLLISFSIFTNGRKLFNINTNTTANNIDCLNGIRVISMMWVIYGHTYFFTIFFPLTNAIDFVDWFKTPYSMLLQAGTVAVDSFLLISGVLLAWVILPKMEKSKGNLNIPLMYFHRYVRLTPVLAAAILFVVGIVPLITQGPFAQNFSSYITNYCQTNWWVTLLYVNNYVQRNSLCLSHTWYLSVDTQLFLISPFVLLGLWKWKSKFLWVLLILAALSSGCCINTMIKNNFNAILFKSIVTPKQVARIYQPTHIRMSPWLIGMGFGYWLHRNRNNKPKLSVVQLMLGWTVAVALWMSVLFGPFHIIKNGTEPTVLEAALYEAFGRSAWSVGLTWIIFVCHTGNSRTVNAFLSYPGWQPIVRLTYTMYISAIILQAVNTANIKTDKYFSNYSVIQTYWAEMGIILSLSIIIVLALESPIIAIENYFFFTKKPKVETTTAIEEGGSKS